MLDGLEVPLNVQMFLTGNDPQAESASSWIEVDQIGIAAFLSMLHLIQLN